jgi:hypothetical protein
LNNNIIARFVCDDVVVDDIITRFTHWKYGLVITSRILSNSMIYGFLHSAGWGDQKLLINNGLILQEILVPVSDTASKGHTLFGDTFF